LAEWTNKQVLITVRTYPTPSAKDIEVSCTGAITLNGEWIRLFPVRYRFLKKGNRFRKYDLIDVRVRRASDARPESFTPDPDSIKIVAHIESRKGWIDRKKIIFRSKSPSMCWLQDQLEVNPNASTLGIFKPKQIKRLIIQPDDPTWTPDQLAKLKQAEQADLFGSQPPLAELEKIPFKFSYEFVCDQTDCSGHSLVCTDWEMNEAYRRWRNEYGPGGWEAAFRQRFEFEMINKLDTHFYVGTVHRWPKSWIIVGLFYPPRI
jgi:hypothetical protein